MPSDDGVDQSYYVGAKIRLTVRIDELGATGKLAPAPPIPTKNLQGVKSPNAPLTYQPDPQNPGRYVLVPAGQTPTNQAAGDQARSSDGLTFDITCIPKTMSWNLAGIRQGDTLSATIKWVDCPLDPRCIRACAVDAFIGAVSNSDYASGIEGNARAGTMGPQGSPESLSVIPDQYLDANNKQRTNRRFRGWVDKWEIEFTDDGEPAIQLECTDNTRLLIDQEMPPTIPIDMNLPLDKAVAQYLSNFSQFQGLSIEYRPTTETPPILKGLLTNSAFRPKLGPQAAKGGGADNKHSVWDYLTDICGSVACSIRLQGDVVVIQRPRTIVNSQVTSRVDDPFQGRTVNGESFQYRRFIYGRNIKEMRIRRSYAHQKPTNYEVRCVNTEKKPPLMVARFPEPKDRQLWAIPGNATPNEHWKVKTVSGIKDLATLKLIAQGFYEQTGRNELQVEVKTRNIASWGGGNMDPDVLDMQFGDTFELLVNRDQESTLTNIEKALTIQGANSKLLQALGFAPDFANTYGQAYASVGVPTQYVLKTMSVEWDEEQGIDLSVVGVNYIVVRADQPNTDAGAPST